jgi:hypothetical protein
MDNIYRDKVVGVCDFSCRFTGSTVLLNARQTCLHKTA